MKTNELINSMILFNHFTVNTFQMFVRIIYKEKTFRRPIIIFHFFFYRILNYEYIKRNKVFNEFLALETLFIIKNYLF